MVHLMRMPLVITVGVMAVMTVTSGMTVMAVVIVDTGIMVMMTVVIVDTGRMVVMTVVTVRLLTGEFVRESVGRKTGNGNDQEDDGANHVCVGHDDCGLERRLNVCSL